MAKKKGPMQLAAEAQAKKVKDAMDAQEAGKACAQCGKTGKTLVTLSTPGVDGTPPICQECMKKAMDILEQSKTAPTQSAGTARREVTEVKYKPKDKLVRIGYDEPHGPDIHNIILESKDMPKSAFVAALQALAPHAATICEMEDPDWIEGVIVLGVKMKPRRSGFGAVISCVKKLQSHAVMCFNTPFLPESADHGPTLPPVVVKCLNTLMAEALAFVDGKRAQGELFEDSSE